MRPLTVFIAGGVVGAVARPYLQRAARNLLVGVIESVEKTQHELEHVEKLKAEAEAAKAEALRLQAEVQQLRDEAQQAAAGPVSTSELVS
jgi:hypothetical protein